MTDRATVDTGEMMLRANGVDLCVQAFGDSSDPAVLLLAGLSASMLGWDEKFCRRMAQDRFVIRYDYRDTGRSVAYPPGEPGYDLRDLVDDAVGVLEHLDVGAAHLVGQSMGGMIAQNMALDAADVVATLTLVSSSPGPGDSDLSPMPESFRKEYEDVQLPDWSDRDAVVEYRLALQRPCTGRGRTFDEARYRELFEREFDRATNIESSMTNHFTMDKGDRWRPRLGSVRVPTIVIHGSDDPVHPLDHGAALANEIPDATLLALKGVGHELPPQDWNAVLHAVAQLSGRAS